jgi:hypothetical protein
MFSSTLHGLALGALLLASRALAGFERLPDKIYGVNLGSW